MRKIAKLATDCGRSEWREQCLSIGFGQNNKYISARSRFAEFKIDYMFDSLQRTHLMDSRYIFTCESELELFIIFVHFGGLGHCVCVLCAVYFDYRSLVAIPSTKLLYLQTIVSIKKINNLICVVLYGRAIECSPHSFTSVLAARCSCRNTFALLCSGQIIRYNSFLTVLILFHFAPENHSKN